MRCVCLFVCLIAIILSGANLLEMARKWRSGKFKLPMQITHTCKKVMRVQSILSWFLFHFNTPCGNCMHVKQEFSHEEKQRKRRRKKCSAKEWDWSQSYLNWNKCARKLHGGNDDGDGALPMHCESHVNFNDDSLSNSTLICFESHTHTHASRERCRAAKQKKIWQCILVIPTTRRLSSLASFSGCTVRTKQTDVHNNFRWILLNFVQTQQASRHTQMLYV